MRPTHLRHHGYIMMMTLLLIAIAAMALVRVSRASLQKALQAKVAQQALQRRWGVASCQAAILPQAEKWLTQIEKETNQPTGQMRIPLMLGNQFFELVLADEQSKANVNTLYEQQGRPTTQRAIKALMGESESQVKVRLSPLESSTHEPIRGPNALPKVGSFAQVFPDAMPDQLVGSAQNPSGSTKYVTCWGNGKLNFKRAARPVLKQVCGNLLTDNQINALIQTRQENPDWGLAEALNPLALTKEKRDLLTERLTEHSSCHSLWITLRDKNRTWYWLTISDVATNDHQPSQTLTFTW